MIRNNGGEHIHFSDNFGICLWAFDNWSNKDKRPLIEKRLIEIEELDYLEYLKKQKA
jgi:hypothetical protein